MHFCDPAISFSIHQPEFRSDLVHWHGYWSHLASMLEMDSWRGNTNLPVLKLLSTTLQQEGLDTATWNSLRRLVDAGMDDVHLADCVDVKQVLRMVEDEGLVPVDLLAAKPALVRVLKYRESQGL